jgi:Sigma-70 region 2
MRTLYVRHHIRVYRFIVRLVTDAGRAEDLVSEVFLDVWSQAGSFEGRSLVSTWILSIERFKALSAIRRRRETTLDETAMEMTADSADTPEQTVLNQDRSVQLRTLPCPDGNTAKSSTSSTITKTPSRRSPRLSNCRHGEDPHILRAQAARPAALCPPGI